MKDNEAQPTTTLEQRVERLEKWAGKPSWLDEPAEIGGEPVVMGDTFPIEIKIFGGVMAAAFIGGVILIVVGVIHYHMTGQPL